MSYLVDLNKKPYNLKPEQIAKVNNLVLNMTLEEKLKQLFVCLTKRFDEEYLKEEMSTCQCGGVRYNPGRAKDIYNHNYYVQKYSKLPCLIAANCEAGGNGACFEGTYLGEETKVAATHNLDNAYQLGYISAKQAKSIGVNTIFAPICDIHHDFHNPVMSNRTFGNDPKLVKDMSLKMLNGIHDAGLLSACKHFPGDGYDERDQHLSPVTNPLSVNEWDKSFGMVYHALIEEGVDMVMCGHIKLPSYQRYFSPDLTSKEIKPASISHELVTELLKEQLGFNGVVITDATHMVGLTCAGKRKDLIPQIINAGCDMILFYNDFDEDMSFIKDGYKNGIISDERLNDAVTRILGLKEKLGILGKQVDEYFPQFDENALDVTAAMKITNRIADEGITLIKDEDNIIPISLSKHKRILIVPQSEENAFHAFMPAPTHTIYDDIKSLLEVKGYQVSIFESLMDKAKKLPPKEAIPLVLNVYNNKTPIHDLTDNYDLIIQFAHFDSHNTVQRISWKLSKGTADIPWYIHEVPTIFVSLCSPFHLFDVPMVKTYINCYDKNIITVRHLIDKLCGEEDFKGVSPVDAYCDDIESRY